jgi:hypothetical protein
MNMLTLSRIIAKIQEGSPYSFPIVKGLQRQEQIAKVQREQQQQQQQQHTQQQRTFASSRNSSISKSRKAQSHGQNQDFYSQQTHKAFVDNTVPSDNQEPDNFQPISRSADARDGPHSGFRNRNMGFPLQDQPPYYQAPIMEHTKTTANTPKDPLVTVHTSPASDALFAGENSKQTLCASYEDHDRPFWTCESPPSQTGDRRVLENHSTVAQYGSSRVSLRPPMRSGQAVTFGRSARYAGQPPRGAAFSQATSSHYAQSLVPPSRQTNESPPYFADHAPQPRLGPITAYRNASMRGLTDSGDLGRTGGSVGSVVRDEEWSTIQERRQQRNTQQQRLFSAFPTSRQVFRTVCVDAAQT